MNEREYRALPHTLTLSAYIMHRPRLTNLSPNEAAGGMLQGVSHTFRVDNNISVVAAGRSLDACSAKLRSLPYATDATSAVFDIRTPGPDAASNASRVHCIFKWGDENESWFVRDVSTHGTAILAPVDGIWNDIDPGGSEELKPSLFPYIIRLYGDLVISVRIDWKRPIEAFDNVTRDEPARPPCSQVPMVDDSVRDVDLSRLREPRLPRRVLGHPPNN